MTRWVVVFNGARDGYQVPLALHEQGMLESLVTDWYTPYDLPAVRALLDRGPASLRGALLRRFRPGLPSARVRTRPLATLTTRLRPGTMRDADVRLGERAGGLACRSGAGILSYTYYAASAFAAAGGGPRVLFQVEAHPLARLEVLEREIGRGEGGEALRAEARALAGDRHFTERCAEPGLADRVLVASGYALDTLAAHGVDPARIEVIPYGVDLEHFRPPVAAPGGPFRVCFVGELVWRKGLGYLLEAWRRAALPDAELVLVGHAGDPALLARYEGSFTLRGRVPRDELRTVYQASDLLCVPSLSEGFGLVYLEAMACGTPVIGTTSTGAPDVASDGREGFIVPPGDADALAERLRWCHSNRGALAAMRGPARAAAERFSWSAFRGRVAAALRRAEGGA